MHGTLRMPRERQEDLREADGPGGIGDSVEVRVETHVEQLLASAYRTRLERVGRTLKMGRDVIRYVRLHWHEEEQHGLISETALDRIYPALDRAEAAIEASSTLLRSSTEDAEPVTGPVVLRFMESLSTAADWISRALLAANNDAGKAADLNAGRLQLVGVLNSINVEMAWVRKLLVDLAENRVERPLSKGAERLRRLRRRKKLGFVGTVSLDYHKQELEILRRLRLIGPDASQEEIHNAMRAFLLSAFSFLDFPDVSLSEYRRTRKAFLEALRQFRGDAADPADGGG